jgi:hypothetical protein
MKVLVLSSDPNFELPHSGKSSLSFFLSDASEAASFRDSEADLVYLDRSGLKAEAFKRYAGQLKKRCLVAAWGVIDREGEIDDPAALFHEGASDFIGPAVYERGVDSARFKRVLDFISAPAQVRAAAPAPRPLGEEPPDEFPGWSSLRPGTEGEFYFLYAAPTDPSFLKAKIGETRYRSFKERFLAYFSQALAEAEALPWIQNDTAVLFLVPPQKAKARLAATICSRVLVSAPLLGYERFGLEVPLSLTLALHKGKTAYQPPGKTGTVISDDVNFIHHLGAKKAQGERLTVTKEAAEAIPKELLDLFVQAGAFEEREICHSRRFIRGSAL